MRKALSLLLALGLVSVPAPLSAQTSDPDVTRGIAQVDEGDYDAAILTLDNAARRLAQDPKRAGDLSQAYLYLGIAYMGKGHEAAAKAKFRAAIGQIKDLTLSPQKFPPKVIDMFEAAKAETAQAAGPAAPATATPKPAAAPKKKGGSGKVILIVGGLAAAAAIAAAAGGAGGGGSAAPTTTTQPPDPRAVNLFGPITLSEANYAQDFKIVVAGTGVLEATLTWTSSGGERAAVLAMGLQDHGSNEVAQSNRTNDTTSVLTANVQPVSGSPSQEYNLGVYHRDTCNGCTAVFNLTVKHP